jgi:uncharacterized protein YndB with AHSA1/START domain
MSSENETHDLVVTRSFNAPQERVWRAWSDPDRVMSCVGPHGFTSPMCRMDFREEAPRSCAWISGGLGALQH